MICTTLHFLYAPPRAQLTRILHFPHTRQTVSAAAASAVAPRVRPYVAGALPDGNGPLYASVGQIFETLDALTATSANFKVCCLFLFCFSGLLMTNSRPTHAL